MKDNNIIEINKDTCNNFFNFPKDKIDDCLKILKKDSLLLAQNNLMDYSLLFGIERVDSLLDVQTMRGVVKSHKCQDPDGSKFY